MRQRMLLAIALGAAIAFAVALSPHGRAGAANAPRHVAPCAAACRAAYRAIARALPRDASNALAPAIVRTRDFSYPELTRALHVPTTAQILARWREASGG
ncbi:MAG TPA: hypothetical protein VFA19_14300 [Gaiellaceae bacterium]|nr:hypothetical protein [Gaiellaceae bacterium]